MHLTCASFGVWWTLMAQALTRTLILTLSLTQAVTLLVSEYAAIVPCLCAPKSRNMVSF